MATSLIHEGKEQKRDLKWMDVGGVFARVAATK